MSETGARKFRGALQALFSLALLAAVVAFVDTGALLQNFAALDPAWLAAALLVTVPQYLFSAARWRLTASRLGAHLPFGTAVAEYYLAVLGNQVLPGGVLGDAARAFRHGRRLKTDGGGYGPALRAVVFERASGQAAMLCLMLAGLLAWPFVYSAAVAAAEVAAVALAAAAGIAAVILLFVAGPASRTRAGTAAKNLLAEARHALLAPDVIGWQILYSFAVLATYLLCFYCAGRALGLELGALQTLTLVPAVLFSMTLPVTIGGWGIREAAAAGLWSLADLAPADGVAISVAYGAVVFVSALPGMAALPGLGKRDVGDQR